MKGKSKKMSFQWFFDIATSANAMQIITVSAGGTEVKKRLQPFFEAYKYYKLGKVSCKFCPASTLPVDPTGLSYEAGENTVDPRDQLTPGLTRITNGEDTFEDLSGLNADQQHALFNNMMLDTRWFKFGLQNGLRRSAYPMYWQIGQLHQDYFPGAITNLPRWDNTQLHTNTLIQSASKATPATPVFGGWEIPDKSNPRGFFQTGHRGRMSWLPTDALLPSYGGSPADKPVSAEIPEIELFKVVLPPAYKTKYYYRVYVTETVYFKGPVVLGLNGYSAIDRFIRPNPSTLLKKPSEQVNYNTLNSMALIPLPNNDGGN